ncbi:MAG: hypothetical protein EOQ47_24310 [Mesorhizobium sp.]|nr:MAG: hypothetical protein EOQ47_24310 [Mesorhizobium sp.]
MSYRAVTANAGGTAPPSGLPAPALRYRSGRSSFAKPSNWLRVRFADHSSPPARGEIGGFADGAHLFAA